MAEAEGRGVQASAFAPAKINLILHVRARRADGYHDLESLVSFAATGDRLTLVADSDQSLQLTGPMAAAASSGECEGAGNHRHPRTGRFLHRHLPDLGRQAEFILDKHLPVALRQSAGARLMAAAALPFLGRRGRGIISRPLPDTLARSGRKIGAGCAVLSLAGRKASLAPRRVMYGSRSRISAQPLTSQAGASRPCFAIPASPSANARRCSAARTSAPGAAFNAAGCMDRRTPRRTPRP